MIDVTADLNDNSLPSLLTVAETAVLLREHRHTIYRRIERGDIPSVRFGTTLRVPRRALLEQLAS